MAVFKDGVNGPFKGKIGNVVGYQWKGLWVMRSRPRPKRRHKWSDLQLANHAKMRLMQDFLGVNKVFVQRGFAMVPEVERMSAYNAAMSYNKINAIKGEYPGFELDYPKIMFSKGDLANPENLHVEKIGNDLVFTWDTRSVGNSRPDDQVMILITYDGLQSPEGILSGAYREVGKETYTIENLFSDKELHIYTAFISDDRKLVSNSVYWGSIDVEGDKRPRIRDRRVKEKVEQEV